MSTKKLFVGIDPGKTGAVAFLDDYGKVVELKVCPVIGDKFDRFGMAMVLKKYWLDSDYEIVHVVLEDITVVHTAGRTGSFTMGEGKGIWEGILPSLELPHSLIAPKEWQKRIWIQSQKVMKTSEGGKTKVVDTKATSLLTVKNLFPEQTLLATPRSSVPHEGLMDALLIAYYCFLMNKGLINAV